MMVRAAASPVVKLHAIAGGIAPHWATRRRRWMRSLPSASASGGDGGSGIVIVRYAI